MQNAIPKSAAIAMAVFFSNANAANAAGSHDGGHGHEGDQNIGQAGSGHVDRVIHVDMGEMFFSPDVINVHSGETIRFTIRNTGEFVHEFNIGTAEMHMAHTEEMMHMMDKGILEADRINHHMMSSADMAHDDPNSALLEPGETTELVWTFDGDAEIELSCNVPGHCESGMMIGIRIVNDHS